MASNRIPDSYDPIIELLEDAADGAQAHGVAVGLKQNDEVALRAALTALVGTPAGPGNVPPAAPGLKALHNAAKANKVAKTALFRTAKSNGRALAMLCVGVLKPRLGTEWNAAWQAVGFTTGSLEIPANPMVLLSQMRAYFAANPTHEVPNVAPGFSVTAAACEAAAQAISTASAVSNQSNTDVGQAKASVEAGMKVARGRLTGLREELAQLIAPESELWYAFGFERPADPETPEVVENLTAVAGAPGSRNLFVDCDDARRADSYRFTVVNAATNAPVAERQMAESEAHFTGLPLNVALRLTVTAVNEAGESQPSPAITVTLT